MCLVLSQAYQPLKARGTLHRLAVVIKPGHKHVPMVGKSALIALCLQSHDSRHACATANRVRYMAQTLSSLQ